MPGTLRGDLHLPPPPDSQGHDHTFKSSPESRGQSSIPSCLSGPTWILVKLILLQEGVPRKDPNPYLLGGE